MLSMNNAICHQADICVIGGGMAGMIAAISAARHGARVVLMHDRPVLGGNASSEIRMWIRGAAGRENRETGILQELELENIYRNPTMNYSLWDSVLLQAVMAEKNITLLLNCSCLDCQTAGNRITSVTGWQLNTYAFHTVKRRSFWIARETASWPRCAAQPTAWAAKGKTIWASPRLPRRLTVKQWAIPA